MEARGDGQGDTVHLGGFRGDMLDGSELPGRPSMVDDRHVEAQMHGRANAKKQSKKKRQAVEKEGKAAGAEDPALS